MKKVPLSCLGFIGDEVHNPMEYNQSPDWYGIFSLQGTNISPKNGILKMIFLFPRWDMLIPWRVPIILDLRKMHYAGQIIATSVEVTNGALVRESPPKST